MEQELIDGQVVQTITIDLPSFVEQKQQELQMISMEMTNLVTRQTSILDELQALIPQETIATQ